MESKEEVKEAVINQLQADDRVLSAGVEVEVFDGTVRLNGTVPKVSDRRAAEEDALAVPGVAVVENNLQVCPPDQYNVISDEQIKKQIEHHFNSKYRLDPAKIKVLVVDGVVSLDGIVNSYWKKDEVEDYAYTRIGVVDVVNNLNVVPTHKASDEKIAINIKDAFKQSVALNGQDIVVEVENGIVTLTGTVAHRASCNTAYEIVSYTSGVTGICNKLETRKE